MNNKHDNASNALDNQKDRKSCRCSARISRQVSQRGGADMLRNKARGIVEGKTEFILIIVGMFMGAALIMMQVKSPMLIIVGMYLPIDTSFAIFVGGLMKGLFDRIAEKRKLEKPNGTR
jgi:uncharacterized oligopeptide transporter (OPT) family protein